MILAGTRPPEYAAALRAERARRTAAADPATPDEPADEGGAFDPAGRPVSAVEIAPRPPAD